MKRQPEKMRMEKPNTTTAKSHTTRQEDEGQRNIRNRDIPLLNRIFYIMQDIISLENRRDWQHDRMFSRTKYLTGMPGGGGVPRGFDVPLAAIDELEEEHGEKLKQYARELKEAERILNAIASPKMRTFVQMYYVDEIGKADIMRELGMTEWGFNQARDRIERAPDMAHVAWRDKYVCG